MNTVRNESCADRVERAAESRLTEIGNMLNLKREDVTLGDHGTLDTVICPGDLDPILYDSLSEYRDDSGAFDLDAFLDDRFDEVREYAYERFYEYGLEFSRNEDSNGRTYFRYLISWGGPSEEIRFYVKPSDDLRGLNIDRIEFWYLDWFDGASTDVTNDERARALFDWFAETDSFTTAYDDES